MSFCPRRVLAPLACGIMIGCANHDAETTANTEDAGKYSEAGTQDAPQADADAGQGAAMPEFKPGCDAVKPCAAGATCVDGVCVFAPGPEMAATLTDPDNDNLPVSASLELGCVGQPAQVPTTPGPKTVTMWGRVDRFGSGPVTADIEVAVFRLADFHPQACVSANDVEACLHDPAKVGTPLAVVDSVEPDAAALAKGWDVPAPKKAGDLCSKHLDCPGGYECRKDTSAVAKVCVKLHGVYAVENVPTDVPLVVRVRAKKATAAGWHHSYLWDVTLYSDRLDDKTGLQPSKYKGQDTYRVNPTIVGEGQWQLVPLTMGFKSIEEGHGVIGGRIRDCGKDGGRGGWPIHNARVAVGQPGQGVAYFNKEEDNPVPDKMATGTDVVGRYAAVDVPPGANRLAAAVNLGGQVTSLGHADLWVVPNALMIVSLPGRTPVLNK
jgi:hypothetical protein